MDDDRALLRSMEIVLRAEGHEVVSFDDPVDAHFFLHHNPPVDVLIVDYLMPGFTGEELLRLARGETGGVRAGKVIMITGHSEFARGLDMAALGVNELLVKPLDLDRLCEVVR